MISRHPTSRTLIIRPLGDLDTLRAEHYRRQLRSLLDEGYRFLIFDLQDTPYVNSSGLGLLIEFYNKTRLVEGSVKLINCSPQILWILEQTHLNKILLEPAGTEPPKAEVIPFESLYTYMSDEMLLLAQIHQITEQILGQDDLPTIGEVILQGLTEALHAQRGAFFLLDPDNHHLSLTSWIDHIEHSRRPALHDLSFIPAHLENKILDDDRVFWRELCDQDRTEDNLFYQLGFETYLAAPIRGRQNKYGLAIIEASPETAHIIQSSTPLVRTLTNLCGLAMEKTALAAQLCKQNNNLNQALEQARGYQQSLMDAGKLAAMGVVITGLGHLINNKMVPLMGYTQMLAQKKDLSEWVNEKIARIQTSSHEMSQIVEKLVKISIPRERKDKVVDHENLIRTALDLLACPIQDQQIMVHAHIEANPPQISGNPDLLLQALLAVLHRACTSFGSDQTDRWIRIVSQGSTSGLRIIIEDNGNSFDEYDEEGWLDPLVPSEAMDHGRIFNYTIPRSIIRRQHGTLTLEPPLKEGKRVIIDLLAAEIPDPTSPSA